MTAICLYRVNKKKIHTQLYYAHAKKCIYDKGYLFICMYVQF